MTLALVPAEEPRKTSSVLSGRQMEARLRRLVADIIVDESIVIATSDLGTAPCLIDGCLEPSSIRQICLGHRWAWLEAGKPERDEWIRSARPRGPLRVSLAKLQPLARLEFAYGLSQAIARPEMSVNINEIRNARDRLANNGVRSVLDHDEAHFPGGIAKNKKAESTRLNEGLLMFTIDELDRLRGAWGPEHEYTRDVWRPRRFGMTGKNHNLRLDFRRIAQPWLREAVKKFIRWRIQTNYSTGQMHRDLMMLDLLAEALTDLAGPNARPAQLDREVIVGFLTLLHTKGHGANGTALRMSSAIRFLNVARQHDWIPRVPADATFYPEDTPRRVPLAPRALPAFVMAQLEKPEHLAKIADARWRLLFPLLMETGLRLRDALTLPIDCIVRDQQSAPYLRYFNHKMKREALVPISAEHAEAILTRATELRERFTDPILFPRERRNPTGALAVGNGTIQSAIDAWIAECHVTDETGASVRFTPHQFRHTLGTRLINNDVPQEVVRKILDHTSTEMTAHYARLHDDTVRRHWERARKVDIRGEAVTIDNDSPLADVQWAKHHLAQATMALSNGYCGLPLQQSCPHANACLTCPVFITTPEFLPQHRQQLEHTHGVIDRAQKRGQLRLIEINQRTADNLEKIITSLEAPDPENEDAR